VLKNSMMRKHLEASKAIATFFFSARLASNRRSGWCGLGEEAHKSLDVLRYRGQEELLANKPQSAQAQAPPSDLIFEFGSAPCLLEQFCASGPSRKGSRLRSSVSDGRCAVWTPVRARATFAA